MRAPVSVSGLGRIGHPTTMFIEPWTNFCCLLNLLVYMPALLTGCLEEDWGMKHRFEGNKKDMNEAFAAPIIF